jgi:WD40 repeat protein
MGQMTPNGGDVNLDQLPNEGELAIYTSHYTGVFKINQITWTPDIQESFTTSIATGNSDQGVYLRNTAGVMKYYEQFGRGYRIRNVSTDAVEATVEVWTSGANVTFPLQWVKNQVLAFMRADGSVRLYDVNTGTVVLDSFVDVPDYFSIDSTYQNLVAVRASDSLLQVYDLAVEPTKLVSYTATPGTYLRYHDEAISITLQGSNNEPVAGAKVEWTLSTIQALDNSVNAQAVNAESVNEGEFEVAPKGKITPNISITDENGVATATYCPPGNDWVSMDQETITAVVRV